LAKKTGKKIQSMSSTRGEKIMSETPKYTDALGQELRQVIRNGPEFSGAKRSGFKPKAKRTDKYKEFSKEIDDDFEDTTQDDHADEIDPETGLSKTNVSLAHQTGTPFESMDIHPNLKKSLAYLGFKSPTEVQEKALKPGLEGRDLLVSSQTGSGKTIAYLLPLVTRLIEDSEATGLVIVPTRELAVQVKTVLQKLVNDSPDFRSVVIVGGAPLGRQLDMLKRKPRIMVATPGRLLDHARRKTARLDRVAFCVWASPSSCEMF
jgi:ATP-dependent helicase YprA (DUF1998 family)